MQWGKCKWSVWEREGFRLKLVFSLYGAGMGFSWINVVWYQAWCRLPLYLTDQRCVCVCVCVNLHDCRIWRASSPVLHNPGSLEIRACGNISATRYYVTYCTSRGSFKVKCPVSGTKTHVRYMTVARFYYVASGTYCSGSELKCPVSVTERLTLLLGLSKINLNFEYLLNLK